MPRVLPASTKLDIPADWTSNGAGLPDEVLYRRFAEVIGGDAGTIRKFRSEFRPQVLAAYSVTGKEIAEVGPGRGEFLDLCTEWGVPIIGADTDVAMADVLRERGLRVKTSDALSFLADQDTCALGGCVAFNVIEHLQPAYLLGCLREASRAVDTEGCLILQSSSPENVQETSTYWSDLTHIRLYHPITVAFYAAQMGFEQLSVVYQNVADFPLRTGGTDKSAYRSYAVVGKRGSIGR